MALTIEQLQALLEMGGTGGMQTEPQPPDITPQRPYALPPTAQSIWADFPPTGAAAPPEPLVPPQDAGPPDMTAAPQEDLQVPMRNLGVAVGGGPAGGPPGSFGQGPGGMVALGPRGVAAGGVRGFTEGEQGNRYGGTLRPGDIAGAEARGTAAGEAAGNTNALLAAKEKLLMQLRVAPSQAHQAAALQQLTALEPQIALAQQREGLPLARATTERGLSEAQTAPGAREKQTVETQREAAKSAAAITQARGTGAEGEKYKAETTAAAALAGKSIEERTKLALKQMDVDMKAMGINEHTSKAFADAFAPQIAAAAKDPAKQEALMGIMKQLTLDMRRISTGPTGQMAEAEGSIPKASATIRQQAEQTAKRQGAVLSPGQKFKAPDGQVYTY